jgi:hypothetical protein
MADSGRADASRGKQVIVVAVGMLAFVVVCVALFFSHRAMQHRASQSLEQRMQCGRQIQRIAAALARYTTTHGGLPTDADGRFSLEPLFTAPAAVLEDRSVLRVPGLAADGQERTYLLASNVSITNFGDEDQTEPVVLLADPPGSHIQRLSNGQPIRRDGDTMELVHLLLTDGQVYFWQGKSGDYKKWADAFATGTPGTAPCPPGFQPIMKIVEDAP